MVILVTLILKNPTSFITLHTAFPVIYYCYQGSFAPNAIRSSVKTVATNHISDSTVNDKKKTH